MYSTLSLALTVMLARMLSIECKSSIVFLNISSAVGLLESHLIRDHSTIHTCWLGTGPRIAVQIPSDPAGLEATGMFVRQLLTGADPTALSPVVVIFPESIRQQLLPQPPWLHHAQSAVCRCSLE